MVGTVANEDHEWYKGNSHHPALANGCHIGISAQYDPVFLFFSRVARNLDSYVISPDFQRFAIK